jgi:hypothetical protein
MFTVVNNTASAETIAECHGQVNDCVNGPAAHLPPRGQLSSPLSSSPVTPNLLVITGYGSQTSCILVPTKPGTAKVTQATASACTAPSAA